MIRLYRTPVKSILDHDPEKYGDRNDEENAIQKSHLKIIRQAALKGVIAENETLLERLNNT